jgi:hypothetical protein
MMQGWERKGVRGGIGGGKTYAKARGQHAGCYDQVGQHEAGHPEGQEDRLARV